MTDIGKVVEDKLAKIEWDANMEANEMPTLCKVDDYSHRMRYAFMCGYYKGVIRELLYKIAKLEKKSAPIEVEDPTIRKFR